MFSATLQSNIAPLIIAFQDLVDLPFSSSHTTTLQHFWNIFFCANHSYWSFFKQVLMLFSFLLQLVDQDTEGECNSECKTIERACQEVIFYYWFYATLAGQWSNLMWFQQLAVQTNRAKWSLAQLILALTLKLTAQYCLTILHQAGAVLDAILITKQAKLNQACACICLWHSMHIYGLFS